MDYMREINAFYDWLIINPVTNSARNLWHALMHTANRAKWLDEFTVAISTLEAKTGMSRSAVYRARNELSQYGRISFRNRDGKQSSVYAIIPFVCHTDTQIETQTERKRNASDTQTGIINTSYPTDTQKKKTNTKTNTRAQAPPVPPEIVEEFSGFVEMRKKIQAPLTDRAIALALGSLEKLAPGDFSMQKQIIDQTVISGWKGFYPLKNPFASSQAYGSQKPAKIMPEQQYSQRHYDPAVYDGPTPEELEEARKL